jgi:hypothetical protein
MWSSMKMTDFCDDGDSTHPWNVGLLLRDYTMLYPRRLSSSYSSPWEPELRYEDHVSCVTRKMPADYIAILCAHRSHKTFLASDVCCQFVNKWLVPGRYIFLFRFCFKILKHGHSKCMDIDCGFTCINILILVYRVLNVIFSVPLTKG